MTILLIIVHVFVCLFLIAVVLLQSGKGAEMGAAFGGSSQTLFGSRGAATFLGKMTTIVAIVFMLTSFILAIVTSKGTSVIKKTAVPQQTIPSPVPVAPVQGGNVQQPMQSTKQQQPAQAPVAKQPVQPSQPAQTK